MKSSRVAQQFAVTAGIALVLYIIFMTADFGYDFHWAVLYEVNPTYKEIFGLWLLKGFALTIQISVISTIIALILGTVFGIARLSKFKPVYFFATAYVEFFRNTPLLVQLFFWYFAFPLGLPDAASQFLNNHNFEFWAATLGLSIYTGSFVAEIVRAGIQAIPHGHLEASFSSGLSAFQTLRFVILPQAFRVIIPPLGSEFLNNMKNSSLAMTIGVAELCWQSQQIESFTFRGFEATSAASLIYLCLSLTISAVMNSVNHHLQIGQDKDLSVFDLVLAFLFKPFSLIGKGIGRGWSWIAGTFGRKEATGPDNESVYLSAWSRFLTIMTRLLVYGWKGLFVVFFAAMIGLAGLIILKFNWGIIWKSMPSLLFWTFPHGGNGEIFYGLGGLSLSIVLAAISLTVSFFIGLVFGLGRLSKNTIISTVSVLYIEIIRGNPLIMVIFWVYFFSPIVTGMQIDVFWSATIAFTVFSGAYIAEIVRAGVSAIPFGQIEASSASGLNYFQIMRFVVLPQALKMMIPAFVGQFIALFKDTSLAYIIGVFELTTIAQTLNNRLMIYPFEIYTTIAALYFVCCYSMSIVACRLEIRYSPDRRVEAPRME
ncbi:MAG: amino acid ABC transporter permease [Deltaproteobacteria bacterium]|nr:amino acid ABC transporter permease [Deltaproteobacteria bacterium]